MIANTCPATGMRNLLYFALVNFVLVAFVVNVSAVSAQPQEAGDLSDCLSFSNKVLSFHQTIAQKGRPSPEELGQLREILAEACSEKYAQCRYTFCTRNPADASPSNEEKGEEAPAAAVGAPTVQPPPRELEPAGVRTSPRTPIQTNPLAWLDVPLQCEELVDQIKARYAPLGTYSDLPNEKKIELGKVLDIACSEKFAQCKFPKCASLKRTQREAVNAAVPAETKDRHRKIDETPAVENVQPSMIQPEKTEAADKPDKVEQLRRAALEERQQTFAQLAERKAQERKRMIDEAVEIEKAQGKLVWTAFSVPGEEEARSSAEIEERPAPRKKYQDGSRAPGSPAGTPRPLSGRASLGTSKSELNPLDPRSTFNFENVPPAQQRRTF